MYGELAVIFLAKINCTLQQLIAAHRNTILLIGAVIGTAHPCGSAGNTAVTDQL